MKNWPPNEWEERVNTLLRARYSLGEYQQVPDGHGGDHGIEGFSTDGCAYQCYSPKEPLSVRDRYEAHRDKMTGDIGKFIANTADLSNMLGPLKIRRWILVVPRHDSSQLVAHAEKKAQEVRDACLPYVDAADFRVMVVTEDAFARERAMLAASAAIEIHIPAPAVDGTEQDLVDAGGPRFLQHLDEKTGRIPRISGTEEARRFRQSIMSYYVQGQVVLDRLRREYPEVFETIIQEKAARARHLELESGLSSVSPSDRITNGITAMQAAIHERFPNISSDTQVSLAMEALADWLLTCPLRFPEVTQ